MLKKIGLIILSVLLLSPAHFASAEATNPNIVQIAGYSGHHLYLDDNGNVYEVGSHYGFNFSSLDENIIYVPRAVEGLPRVKKITAGMASFALTEEGDVYAWGEVPETGLSGEVSINEFLDIDEKPKKLEGLGKIRDIWTGLAVTFAVDEYGQYYVWGYDRGRYIDALLGIEDEDHVYAPTKVDLMPNIKMIEPGYFNGFIVTVDGSMYSIAAREDGGDVIRKEESVENIRSVSSKMDGGLAVTTDGQVYAWGYNYDNQLLIGEDMRDVTTPVKVEGLKNIEEVSAYEVLAARDRNGKVYVWGYSEYLPYTEKAIDEKFFREFYEPKYNGSTAIDDAVSIMTDGYSVSILNSKGEVYRWGEVYADSSAGELGSDYIVSTLGEEEIVATKYPIIVSIDASNARHTSSSTSIPTTTTGEVSVGSSSEQPSIMPIILAMVFVVVGAGIAIFFILHKKKPQPTGALTPNMYPQQQPIMQNPGMTNYRPQQGAMPNNYGRPIGQTYGPRMYGNRPYPQMPTQQPYGPQSNQQMPNQPYGPQPNGQMPGQINQNGPHNPNQMNPYGPNY